jgi:Type I phosphodiesterase / nucleotide pyrophosphatase
VVRHRRRSQFAILATLALLATSVIGGAAGTRAASAPPARVLIVLFDQMIPSYADQFDMPNFRRIRDAGTYFKNAYLGYMASETVIAHNVITSGQSPRNMGWVDEAYRDSANLFGKGVDAMHITGDLSLADFSTIVDSQGYPKLADYLHTAYPAKKFITVGEKSYAVESATASTGDIAVRLSGRSSSSLFNDCRTLLGGRYRGPTGKNVPSYIGEPFCNRFWINSDGGNSYGTAAAFPSWMYPEDGNRFFPGTDASAQQLGHLGGDTWVADAAISMMQNEDWSGMFVTMGAIDKAAHMWGAQNDTGGGACSTGAEQTHVKCAAANADVQFGRLLEAVAAVDAAKGGETLVVLTADHGATYGEDFYGKTTAGAGDSNWYYAPNGVWDAGSLGSFDTTTYNNPSPALQPLLDNGNLAFVYGSTAVEAWLLDRSPSKMQEAAAAALQLPGATATYYRSGDGFALYGTNKMTQSEKAWWKDHGQEIVDTMAAPNGPDIVALLHDKTSYGVYGDHGGAQESVQRVPMVFWSPSLAYGAKTGRPFRTTDVMPTILETMGIPLTAPVDGTARRLGH